MDKGVFASLITLRARHAFLPVTSHGVSCKDIHEYLRCGEERVADDMKRKKTLFTNVLLRALDRVAFNG